MLRPGDNKILLSDFVIETKIGIYDHEKDRPQRVKLTIVAMPEIWPDHRGDNIEDTVSYDHIVKIVQTLAEGEHIHLVETFAEMIARDCLENLPLQQITIRVEKLDIYPFAVPGVEIIRRK